MYNNIGLRTPRGSGTSGHVMSNRSHVRPQNFRMGLQRNTGKLQTQNWEEPAPRKANGELLDHLRKRKVEAKIFELQEAMAERGYSDAEIEAKVEEVRRGLEEREGSSQQAKLPSAGRAGGSGSGYMDTHMRDVKKAEDNRRMREAFGLGDDFTAGEAFDEHAQERKKEARKREREAKKAEWEAKKAAKIEEGKRQKQRESTEPGDEDRMKNNDVVDDDTSRSRRKKATVESPPHDEEDREYEAKMKERVKRFGSSNATNGSKQSSREDGAGGNPAERRGRGQFRAGGSGYKGNRDKPAANQRSDKYGEEEGRGRGRYSDRERYSGRSGNSSREDRPNRPVNVKDALAGGLSAPRDGDPGMTRIRRSEGNSEKERRPSRLEALRRDREVGSNGSHDRLEENKVAEKVDQTGDVDGHATAEEGHEVGVREEERWRPDHEGEEDEIVPHSSDGERRQVVLIRRNGGRSSPAEVSKFHRDEEDTSIRDDKREHITGGSDRHRGRGQNGRSELVETDGGQRNRARPAASGGGEERKRSPQSSGKVQKDMSSRKDGASGARAQSRVSNRQKPAARDDRSSKKELEGNRGEKREGVSKQRSSGDRDRRANGRKRRSQSVSSSSTSSSSTSSGASSSSSSSASSSSSSSASSSASSSSDGGSSGPDSESDSESDSKSSSSSSSDSSEDPVRDKRSKPRSSNRSSHRSSHRSSRSKRS